MAIIKITMFIIIIYIDIYDFVLYIFLFKSMARKHKYEQ